MGQEEVLDDEFALDLRRRLDHGVRVNLEVDLRLDVETKTLLEFAADIQDVIFGTGIAKPETNFVHLRPDAHDRSVDHRATLFEGLADEREDHVEPAKEAIDNDDKSPQTTIDIKATIPFCEKRLDVNTDIAHNVKFHTQTYG